MVNNVSNSAQIKQIYTKVKAKQADIEQPKNQEKQPVATFNSAYVTPFIQRSNYTQNEREFIQYRDKFCEVVGQVITEYNKANWDFYINSTTENANTLNLVAQSYNDIFLDEEAYNQFQEYNERGINDKKLQEHMGQILGNFRAVLGENEANSTSDTEEKSTPKVSENEISQVFNSFKPQIEGKNVSQADINDIMKNSKDIEMRKKAYIAQNASGDAIAEDLILLVKQRNEEAKAKGYNSYYSMMLEKYGTTEEQLFKLLDDLNAKSDAAFQKINARNNERVCKNFGISAEEIRPWHFGLRTAESISKKADSYFTTEKLQPLNENIYSKMGWDIKEMPITMDLFPRDNKNGHGFCFCVEPGKDTRILANLYGDLNSMETLLHETGHAVYNLGISTSLPYFDREVASNVMTESVAMLMQTLPQREGLYEKELNMPKELSDRLEEIRIENLTYFIKDYIFYSNFEKQLYENPDQDIKKLWFDLKKEYTGANPPDELNNEWATVPHFLSHPGYLQNYLRAEVMASQIYDAAHEQIGDLSQSTETAKFFQENIFKYGSSKTEEEIMKIATGKELSAEAFCKQLEKISV